MIQQVVGCSIYFGRNTKQEETGKMKKKRQRKQKKKKKKEKKQYFVNDNCLRVFKAFAPNMYQLSTLRVENFTQRS